MSLKTFFAVFSVLLVLTACSEDKGGLRPKIGVGDHAPKSENRTVSNADDWHQVSSMLVVSSQILLVEQTQRGREAPYIYILIRTIT